MIASVVVYESEKSGILLDFQAASFNNHMRQVLLQYRDQVTQKMGHGL